MVRHKRAHRTQRDALAPMHGPVQAEPFIVRLVWQPEQVFQRMGRHKGVWPLGDNLLEFFGYRHGRDTGCTSHKTI